MGPISTSPGFGHLGVDSQEERLRGGQLPVAVLELRRRHIRTCYAERDDLAGEEGKDKSLGPQTHETSPYTLHES